MDIFPAPRLPDLRSTTVTESPRVISNKFGDGYAQTAADGFNACPLSVSASWNPAYAFEVDAMVAFLRAHVGQAFLWTAPRENAPRAWICTGWKRDFVSGVADGLTVSFEERFDLQNTAPTPTTTPYIFLGAGFLR